VDVCVVVGVAWTSFDSNKIVVAVVVVVDIVLEITGLAAFINIEIFKF
jgi:hypothetical protein